MKREEHYCDVCGKQMTYVDSDGNTCIHGINIPQRVGTDLPTRILVNVDCKKDHGHSYCQKSIEGTEFCSYHCFIEKADMWAKEIKTFILANEGDLL